MPSASHSHQELQVLFQNPVAVAAASGKLCIHIGPMRRVWFCDQQLADHPLRAVTFPIVIPTVDWFIIPMDFDIFLKGDPSLVFWDTSECTFANVAHVNVPPCVAMLSLTVEVDKFWGPLVLN